MAKTKAGEPQITGDKRLRRTIRVYGVEGFVCVTLSAEGLEIKAKGSNTALNSPWPEVVAAMPVPESAPAKFYNDPMGLLKDKGSKRAKKRSEKLQKAVQKEIDSKESQ